MSKFKVGDRVKLKDYSSYPDYRDHEDKTAVITDTHFHSPIGDLTYHLEWESDGKTSAVSSDNMILQPGDWDE